MKIYTLKRLTLLKLIILLIVLFPAVLQAGTQEDSTSYYIRFCDSVQVHTKDSSVQITGLQKAINWFSSTNNSKYKAWCYSLMGDVYRHNNRLDSACNCYSISSKIYKESNLADSCATVYNKLGTCRYIQGDFKRAEQNFKKALLYPASKSVKADILNGLAISYEGLNCDDSALLTYNRALDLYKEIGDSMGIAYMYTNIGGYYFQNTEMKKEAEIYFKKAYNIIVKSDDKPALASITSNLAAIYSDEENYEKALESYLQSYKIDSTLDDKFQIGIDLNNIGLVYLHLKDTSLANNYILKSYNIAKSIGAKQLLSYTSYNLGEIEIDNNNFTKAIDFAKISLSAAKESGNKEDVSSAYKLLSDIYSKQGNYKKAFTFIKSYIEIHDTLLSVEKAKQLAYIKEKYDAAQNKNRILFLEKENLRKSNIQLLLIIFIVVTILFLLFIVISFLLVKKNRDKIKTQQLYFEKLLSNSIEYTFVVGKDKRIKYLSPSFSKIFIGKIGDSLEKSFYKNLTEENITKSNNLLISIINGAKRVKFDIAATSITGKKQHLVGVAQNFLNDNIIDGIIINLWDVTELKNISNALRLREKELNEANETKEKIFSIISHDLIGHIGTTSELMKLLNDQYDELDKKHITKIISSVSNSLETTYTLVSNLLSWARIQMNKITTERKPVLLYPIIEKIINLYKNQLEDKSITVHFGCDRTPKVNADFNQLEIIFRNLVRNSIKFTPIGGNIWITCNNENATTTICIKDDGIGMTSDQVNALLSNKTKIVSTTGTKNEQGTGLGMLIVKELIQLNKGKLRIKSSPNKGTEVYVTLLT